MTIEFRSAQVSFERQLALYRKLGKKPGETVKFTVSVAYAPAFDEEAERARAAFAQAEANHGALPVEVDGLLGTLPPKGEPYIVVNGARLELRPYAGGVVSDWFEGTGRELAELHQGGKTFVGHFLSERHPRLALARFVIKDYGRP